jgi:uncharacterized protein (DUF58 family)
MLYPDFKELVSYENTASVVGYHIKNKKFSELSGSYTSSFKGQGLEFNDIRQYEFGDDIRNIDWHVTAKLDSPHVKIYKEEKQRNVLICIDKNDYMNFGTRVTFKNVIAARIASILAFAANKNSDRVGFYLFGNLKDRFEFFKPQASKISILKGLRSLCNSEDFKQIYSIDGAIFNLKRLDVTPNIIFIISDFRGINETFEKNLYLISKRAEVVFINVVDDSDFFIPDVGKIILKQGNRRYLLNTSYRTGIKNYQRNFEEKIASLTKIKNKLRARYIQINTKDDPLKSIMLALKK